MSGFMGISSAGMALGPVFGGLITEFVNFRAVFLVYAVSGGCRLGGRLGQRGKHPGGGCPVVLCQPAARSLRRFFVWQQLADWGRLLKSIVPEYRVTYGVLVFVTTIMMLYRMVLQSMLPLYAGSHLGYSPTQVGSLFLMTAIFVFAMIVAGLGSLPTRLGESGQRCPAPQFPASHSSRCLL